MLRLLNIRDFVIVDRLELEFSAGFGVLTGETGAGKSIVIDALSAVLGQRTSRDLIRTGSEKAFVSASFCGVPPEALEDPSLAPEGELLLQREISLHNLK